LELVEDGRGAWSRVENNVGFNVSGGIKFMRIKNDMVSVADFVL
jgi:hypothetical protein